MIVGLGSDLIDIRRVEKTLARFGARFEERIFTERERTLARKRSKAGARITASTYAKRFAAKEACAKALGTGLNFGVYWRDMEVVNLPTGQPTLQLRGAALKHLQRLTPAGKQAHINLTMTDDYPHAQALVLISVS